METLSHLFKRKATIEREVDEELLFHIDNQADDYETAGRSPEESRKMAESRFGDVEKIRTECIRIESGRRVLVLVLNSLFIASLLVGLFFRAAIPLAQVNRVGDVMMMIGVLGILLVYFKQAGTFVLRSGSDRLPLGLNKDAQPTGFDAQGRSPFDRVKADE